MQDTAVRGAMASTLAFAMATANPVMTSAVAPTMAVRARQLRSFRAVPGCGRGDPTPVVRPRWSASA